MLRCGMLILLYSVQLSISMLANHHDMESQPSQFHFCCKCVYVYVLLRQC